MGFGLTIISSCTPARDFLQVLSKVHIPILFYCILTPEPKTAGDGHRVLSQPDDRYTVCNVEIFFSGYSES